MWCIILIKESKLCVNSLKTNHEDKKNLQKSVTSAVTLPISAATLTISAATFSISTANLHCHSPHLRCHSPHLRCHSPHLRCHSPHLRYHYPHHCCHSPHLRCHSPHHRCHSPHLRRPVCRSWRLWTCNRRSVSVTQSLPHPQYAKLPYYCHHLFDWQNTLFAMYQWLSN